MKKLDAVIPFSFTVVATTCRARDVMLPICPAQVVVDGEHQTATISTPELGEKYTKLPCIRLG